MKIVAFAVWLECPGCHGAKLVSGGLRQYGEMVPCAQCNAKGAIRGTVSVEDFNKLITGLTTLGEKK